MKKLFHELYRHFRESRFYGGKELPHSADLSKRYPRMPHLALEKKMALMVSLGDALAKRRSARKFSAQRLSFAHTSQLFAHALALTDAQRRPYPSGGGYYPIECYVIAFSIEGFEKGVYHYRPDIHEMEYLWPLDTDTEMSRFVKDPMTSTGGLIVLTARCEKSIVKYHDFALALALIESGHVMQNLALTAAALDIGLRPLGGFNETAIASTLDIVIDEEMPLYCAAIGTEQI